MSLKESLDNLLDNYGCLGLGLILLAIFLLVVPAVLFIGATITGGLVYLAWNLAIAPVFGVAPIVMWWQAWGFGLLCLILSSIFKSAFKSKGG